MSIAPHRYSVFVFCLFFWRLPNLKKSNAVSSSGGPHKPWSTQFLPVDTQSALSYNDISVISSFVCSFGPITSTPLFKGQLRKANLRVASHSEPIITQWVWVDSVKGVVYDAPWPKPLGERHSCTPGVWGTRCLINKTTCTAHGETAR